MTDEILNGYKAEVKKICNNLEKDLLLLEINLKDKKIIENIFRGMHTLKGASGMFGYGNIETITHHLESVFSEIREDNVEVTEVLIEQTLLSVDIIKKIIKKQINDSEVENHIELLIDNIQNNDSNENQLIGNENDAQDILGYAIIFSPDERIMQRGLNPLKIFAEIEELGIYEEIIHNNKPDVHRQIEDNKVIVWWEIFVKTSLGIGEITDTFLFYKDDEYSIFEIKGDTINSISGYEEKLNDLSESEPIDIESRNTLISNLLFNIDSPKVEQVDSETIIKQEEVEKIAEPEKKETKNEVVINVASKKLDEMMNLVSDLVTTKSELTMIAEEIGSKKLNNVVEKIDKLSKKFRDNAIDIRLVPISTIEVQLKRIVRDLSKELGKKVDFVTEGMDTELDKTIVTALENPLVHVIRNAIDHGLETPEARTKKNKNETGVIKFVSFYSGSNVYIQVQDDGGGINLDKIREAAIKKGFLNESDNPSEKELLSMIIQPGFTTAESVSLVSGRGVGMDIVQKEISSIRGILEINTEKDLGTIVTIKLPLTLSIMDTIQVSVNGSFFLIPVTDIEFVYEEFSNVLLADENRQFLYKEKLLPFIYLREIFNLPENNREVHTMLIINKDERRFGLVVDHIIGDHQAVLKPLGEVFANLEYLSGSSILGDGSLAFIIDTSILYRYQLENKQLVN